MVTSFLINLYGYKLTELIPLPGRLYGYHWYEISCRSYGLNRKSIYVNCGDIFVGHPKDVYITNPKLKLQRIFVSGCVKYITGKAVFKVLIL